MVIKLEKKKLLLPVSVMGLCLTAESLVAMLFPRFALRSSIKKAEGKLKFLLLLETAWVFEHLIWFAVIVLKTKHCGKGVSYHSEMCILQVEEVIMTSLFLLKLSCFLSSQRNKKNHPTDRFWVSGTIGLNMHLCMCIQCLVGHVCTAALPPSNDFGRS